MSPFLLESPRWLLGQDPDSAQARAVIQRTRGFRHEAEVENEVRVGCVLVGTERP